MSSLFTYPCWRTGGKEGKGEKKKKKCHPSLFTAVYPPIVPLSERKVRKCRKGEREKKGGKEELPIFTT